MSDEVLVEREGGVLTITLNRPEARNAVNNALAVGLESAIDAFEADDELSVAILTGAGGTFCAGMDLKAFVQGEEVRVRRGFAVICTDPPTKPIIAAVEGYALAGGCEIMLSCDLVAAATDARFGLPEVKRGLVAGAGGLFRLPERIPYHLAMEFSLTGEFFDAVRAHQLGLVNRLTEKGGALTAARELAATIVANAPLAVEATKRIVVESRGWPVEERFERSSVISTPVRQSEDAKEGARAFAEKRAPVWRRV